MKSYENIIVAVDLHPACDELIIQRAVDIANLHKAKITVIHAVEPMHVYGPALAYLGDKEEQIFKEAQEKLSALSRKYNISPSQQITESGDPRSVILQQAKKLNTDLIIIGSHGRHGIALLLGSTANGVIHQALCDTLVIRVKKE